MELIFRSALFYIHTTHFHDHVTFLNLKCLLHVSCLQKYYNILLKGLLVLSVFNNYLLLIQSHLAVSLLSLCAHLVKLTKMYQLWKPITFSRFMIEGQKFSMLVIFMNLPFM